MLLIIRDVVIEDIFSKIYVFENDKNYFDY